MTKKKKAVNKTGREQMSVFVAKRVTRQNDVKCRSSIAIALPRPEELFFR